MKIWLVTIGEPVPTGEATTDRLHRVGLLACYLAEHGHDVTWWTSTFDHFHKAHHFGDDTELKINDHLRIKLLYGSGYKKNISLDRIKDQRIIASKFAQQAEQERIRPQVILASLPVIELCDEAVKYGKKFGVPVILDMRDMWPDICMDTLPSFISPIVKTLLHPMYVQSQRACSEATAIIGITDAFLEWGLKRGKRMKTNLDRVFPFTYNQAPLDPTQMHLAEEFWDNHGINKDSQDFIVCFFGALGHQLDLTSAIEAARYLEANGSNIRWVICGAGDKLEQYRLMASDLKNVVIPGWANAAQIRVLMQRSSVGLDPMPPRENFLANFNNKALEYLSAGLPIVSSPKAGVLHDVLKKHNCGLSYDLSDSKELVSIIEELSRDKDRTKQMSDNAIRLFNESFTIDKVYGEMMGYLSQVANLT